MADKIVRTSQEEDLQQKGFDDVHVKLNSILKNVELLEKGCRLTALLLGSPRPAVDGAIQTTWSQGGTPILGSEMIEPSVWKSGLLTPVQGLSPNSTALTLLARFAKGDIQMQGEAVKHLQEGNLAKLKNITIELMKLDGKVLGTIENVNIFEEGIEKVEEPTIGEMLNELESKSEVMADTVTNVCSMGKSKKGKVNPTKPSPASEK